jgi:hypothetical protein
MTANEYALCCRGYFLRTARSQEPFRELYRLIWNMSPTPPASKIRSNAALARHWPLLTDPKGLFVLDEATMKERLDKALELTRKMKNKSIGYTDPRHQYN